MTRYRITLEGGGTVEVVSAKPPVVDRGMVRVGGEWLAQPLVRRISEVTEERPGCAPNCCPAAHEHLQTALGHGRTIEAQRLQIEGLERELGEVRQALRVERQHNADLTRTLAQRAIETARLRSDLQGWMDGETVVKMRETIQEQDRRQHELEREIEALNARNELLKRLGGEKEGEIERLNDCAAERWRRARELERELELRERSLERAGALLRDAEERASAGALA